MPEKPTPHRKHHLKIGQTSIVKVYLNCSSIGCIQRSPPLFDPWVHPIDVCFANWISGSSTFQKSRILQYVGMVKTCIKPMLLTKKNQLSRFDFGKLHWFDSCCFFVVHSCFHPFHENGCLAHLHRCFRSVSCFRLRRLGGRETKVSEEHLLIDRLTQGNKNQWVHRCWFQPIWITSARIRVNKNNLLFETT